MEHNSAACEIWIHTARPGYTESCWVLPYRIKFLLLHFCIGTFFLMLIKTCQNSFNPIAWLTSSRATCSKHQNNSANSNNTLTKRKETQNANIRISISWFYRDWQKGKGDYLSNYTAYIPLNKMRFMGTENCMPFSCLSLWNSKWEGHETLFPFSRNHFCQPVN